MIRFIWKYTLVFVVLFIATFEFNYRLFFDSYRYINPFFENLVYWSGTLFFNLSTDFSPNISSDSIGLYVHTFNLIIISVLLAFIWSALSNTTTIIVRQWTLTIVRYYLSLQMLLYGFNKVSIVRYKFMLQFSQSLLIS